MSKLPTVSSAQGYVPGVNHDENLICQHLHMTNSMGCTWFGCDYSDFSLPLLMIQLILIFISSFFFASILRPLRQSILSCQLIGGIVLVWFIRLDKNVLEKLFPETGRFVLDTTANFGFMLHCFNVGVQIDTTIIKSVHRHMVVMGCMSFLIPATACILCIMAIPNVIKMEEHVLKNLSIVAALSSMTTFPAVTSTLTDLNMLNSELGRLACSTGFVTDVCSYFISLVLTTLGIALQIHDWKPLNNIFWFILFILFLCFVIRPFVLWMARRVPEGQQIRETQFIVIFIAILFCGFLTELLGQNSSFGGFMMGIIVPDGPPFGLALVNRIDWVSDGILTPAKFAISAFKVNFKSLGGNNFVYSLVTEFIIIVAYTVKFVCNFVLAMYYSVPLQDAFHFGMIMCTKGIIDVAAFTLTHANGVLTDQGYSLLIINMIIVTGGARLLIWNFYDPSSRYQTYKRNSIVDCEPGDYLRMVVCIHNEDNVPTIINLLEASNPTRARPIAVFTMNLLELTGRASAILVPNSQASKIPSAQSRVSQIVNAFDYLEQRNQDVLVQNFTAMAPYGSMHEDIFTIAIDKCANIIIIPFHKQWAIDGSIGATFPGIRTVNLKIMDKPPCSVGILVDRGQIGGPKSVLRGRSEVFRITQLFLGGADDREALAYSIRMAQHPNTTLLLVLLKPIDTDQGETFEKSMDNDMIERFGVECRGRNVVIHEEVAKDAVETVQLIRSLEKDCDLFIVGREHGFSVSQLTYGLTEWSECPELGGIGDLLATSEFRFSVLVVQQQPFEVLDFGDDQLPFGEFSDGKIHPSPGSVRFKQASINYYR